MTRPGFMNFLLISLLRISLNPERIKETYKMKIVNKPIRAVKSRFEVTTEPCSALWFSKSSFKSL